MTPPELDAARTAAYSLCYQILRHAQDAEDASQTVLLQLLDHLPQIQDAKHLTAFLHKACFHVSLNLKRSQRRRLDHERIRAERSAAEAPMQGETLDAIHEHLARLDDAARSLLVGRYFERRTLQELASDAGCSTTSVGKRLEKAREELLQSLNRVGVALTLPSLDGVLGSIVPGGAPSGPLSPAVLARISAWTPVAAGAVLKTKAAVAVAVLVAFVGAGLLLVGAARRHPTQDLALAVPSGAASRPASSIVTIERPAPPSRPPIAGNEAAEDPKPARRSTAVLDGLIAFMRTQNRDGSWGDGVAPLEGRLIDPVGVTALALLAFQGAGYSHISKDVYDGLETGPAVRRSLKWLLDRQRSDGTFLTSGEDRLTQALGVLALSEAYGMTATQGFKDPTQRAVDALMKIQREDGSWGDPTTSLWAAEALHSARLSELTIDPEAMALAQRYYREQLDAGPSLPAVIGHIFLSRDGTHPAIGRTSAWISAMPPDQTRPEFMYWYMGSLALFQIDGPEGAMWKQWREPFARALIGTQQREGFWPGGTQSATVLQSSLALLALEVYYRYANIFAGGALQK